jgi:hypothetical protein
VIKRYELPERVRLRKATMPWRWLAATSFVGIMRLSDTEWLEMKFQKFRKTYLSLKNISTIVFEVLPRINIWWRTL